MKDKELAEAIRSSLQKTPELTTEELVAEHEASHEQVVRVLDSYWVNQEDDTVAYVGPGLGGGWLTDEQAESVIDQVADPTVIEPRV